MGVAQIGAAQGSAQVTFRVYLPNRMDATSYAMAVSTPGNALYGKFLMPAQFHKQFSPTSSQVSAVTSWLKSQVVIRHHEGGPGDVPRHGPRRLRQRCRRH